MTREPTTSRVLPRRAAHGVRDRDRDAGIAAPGSRAGRHTRDPGGVGVASLSSAARRDAPANALRLVPLTLRAANAFVARHHRHAGPTRGMKFALGAQQAGRLVGVAIVGRPLARALDDGATLEVLRLCTTGAPNACSFLYGAARRAARARPPAPGHLHPGQRARHEPARRRLAAGGEGAGRLVGPAGPPTGRPARAARAAPLGDHAVTAPARPARMAAHPSRAPRPGVRRDAAPADGRRGRPVGQPGRPAPAKKLRRRHPVRAETPPLVGAGRPREDGTVRPPPVAPWPEPPEEVSAPTPAAVPPEAPDPTAHPATPAAQVSSRRKAAS